MTTAVQDVIMADMPEAFDPGWNLLDGVTVAGRTLTIEPATYFFTYENPTWRLCDWTAVERKLLGVQESTETALEQKVLDFINANSYSTNDPSKVLRTAYQVYAYIFRTEHLNDPAIADMGTTVNDLRVLVEMGTVMALNRVEQDGTISNAGPAWLFGEAARIVYDLGPDDARRIDELYHGGWFNESRRIEQVKAHAALGGRLVHGCQSGGNMAGGCVAPYGADIARFREQLGTRRDEWIMRVRACAR